MSTKMNTATMKNMFSKSVKGFIAIIMVFSFGLIANAQQTALINHYYVNPFLTNPAMAGEFGTNLYLLNRSQWLDVEGAPQTFVASMDGMVRKSNFGYGLTAMSDVTNIVGRTSLYGTYAYKINFNESAALSFGLSAGYEQNKLLFDRISSPNPEEITLINYIQSKGNFDANTGLAFQWNHLRIGAAAYQLLANRNTLFDSPNNQSFVYAFQRHYVFNLGYRLELEKDKIFIDPYVQARVAGNMQPQYDMNAMLNFADMAWIGGGFRTNYGGNFMVGGVLAKHLVGSYSYGRSVGDLKRLSANAHEFMIGYKFDGIVNRKDSDKDGIPDMIDGEPNTMAGCEVNQYGVALDDDRDSVANCIDQELNTFYGAEVNELGVALDGDADGVPDIFDREPNTPKDCPVDKLGMSSDMDYDGVSDCIDMQLKTPLGSAVDEEGVAIDSDKDKVPDFYDLEPNTPHSKHVNGATTVTAANCIVDKHGVAKDTDFDGVTDCVDKDMFTPRGAVVDKNGVAVDSDKDGVADGIDAEPNTPKSAKVDSWGRSLPSNKAADDDNDGVPNSIDLEPNTPSNTIVDAYGRTKSKPAVNPIISNKIEIDEMEDNSSNFDYYVIIGVFKVKSNVEGYQATLKSRFGESTKVLVTPAGYNYVYTKRVLTRDEAHKETDRLKQKNIEEYINGNPWMWREPKVK